jgi:hypothetical protein
VKRPGRRSSWNLEMNILNKIRETLERISRNESLVGGLVV